MREILLAFGRGFIKVLISLLVGAGAGLLALGIAGRDKPNMWEPQRGPAAELFLGVGVGLLTSGAVMAILFLFGRRRAPETARGEPASRAREDAS